MLIPVTGSTPGQPCGIVGFGHSELAPHIYYDHRRFISTILTSKARAEIQHELDPGRTLTQTQLLAAANTKFIEATGIHGRYIWPGRVGELAEQAARPALVNAATKPDEIDAIIVGSNTSDSYSLATDVKLLLSAPTSASVFDVQVACPVGVAIVRLGWHLIRSGTYRRVLVIAAEKASALASPDDYRAANLFGDAAFAMVLGPAGHDDFVLFDDGSDPFDGKEKYITRTINGFQQNGRAVHEFVATAIPIELDRALRQCQIDPQSIDHFFPHQPSAKTIEFLMKKLRRRWPAFRAQVHTNIAEMGNTSGACTGWMISRAQQAGQLQPGQMCLVASFGAGMSWGMYAFSVR